MTPYHASAFFHRGDLPQRTLMPLWTQRGSETAGHSVEACILRGRGGPKAAETKNVCSGAAMHAAGGEAAGRTLILATVLINGSQSFILTAVLGCRIMMEILCTRKVHLMS